MREAGKEPVSAVLASDHDVFAEGLGMVLSATDDVVGIARGVLAMLANGYSNQRIAAECVLSLNTVRAHVQNVLVKLGVHTRLEAAAFAVRRGFAAS